MGEKGIDFFKIGKVIGLVCSSRDNPTAGWGIYDAGEELLVQYSRVHEMGQLLCTNVRVQA